MIGTFHLHLKTVYTKDVAYLLHQLDEERIVHQSVEFNVAHVTGTGLYIQTGGTRFHAFTECSHLAVIQTTRQRVTQWIEC